MRITFKIEIGIRNRNRVRIRVRVESGLGHTSMSTYLSARVGV